MPLVGFSWCAHSARRYNCGRVAGEIMVSMTVANDDLVAWLLEATRRFVGGCIETFLAALNRGSEPSETGSRPRAGAPS